MVAWRWLLVAMVQAPEWVGGVYWLETLKDRVCVEGLTSVHINIIG